MVNYKLVKITINTFVSYEDHYQYRNEISQLSRLYCHWSIFILKF